MNKQQQKMIFRLIDIKQRAADAAETAHIEAHNVTRAADERLKLALKGWKTFTEEAPQVGSIADLEDRDRQYKWLRRAIDEAEKAVYVARADEAKKRDAMTTARVELRRYETWLQNTQEMARIENARLQQLADDEVAARNRNAAANG